MFTCHQRVDKAWKALRIPLQIAATEACWGHFFLFFLVLMYLKRDLQHLLPSAPAKNSWLLLTAGIVLFHCPPMKNIRIKISALRCCSQFSAAPCENLSAVFQQEEKTSVPTSGVIPKPDPALLLRRTQVNLCRSLD